MDLLSMIWTAKIWKSSWNTTFDKRTNFDFCQFVIVLSWVHFSHVTLYELIHTRISNCYFSLECQHCPNHAESWLFQQGQPVGTTMIMFSVNMLLILISCKPNTDDLDKTKAGKKTKNTKPKQKYDFMSYHNLVWHEKWKTNSDNKIHNFADC